MNVVVVVTKMNGNINHTVVAQAILSQTSIDDVCVCDLKFHGIYHLKRSEKVRRQKTVITFSK